MNMTLRTRIANLKYDWAHAPKKQRGGLIACAVAIVGIACLWQALAGVQDATLGTKGGNPFGEPVPEQQQEAPGSSQKQEPIGEASGSEEEVPSVSAENGTDVSIVKVSAHADGCVSIDSLPAVAAPAAPAAEQQLQALLDARFGGGRGASAYLDAAKGVTVTQGEAEQVIFAIAIVGDDGRDIVGVGMSYTPTTRQFGITSATVAAEPPDSDKSGEEERG